MGDPQGGGDRRRWQLIPALRCSLIVLAMACIAFVLWTQAQSEGDQLAEQPDIWALSRFVSANCPDLFRYEPTPVGNDSIPPERHYPKETLAALTPPPMNTPSPAGFACVAELPLLQTETVIEEAGEFGSFQLDPSGKQVALDIWPNDLAVLNTETGERRILPDSKADWLLFWGDESSVFALSVYPKTVMSHRMLAQAN